MKANELMIGDWLLSYDDDELENIPVKVVSIDVDGWVFYEYPDKFIEEGWCKNLYPVPLTNEILEQNGWKWNEYHTMMTLVVGSIHIGWGFYKDCLSISDHSDDGDCQITSLKCEYVHQLQHVLKICEIEKEIEL